MWKFHLIHFDNPLILLLLPVFIILGWWWFFKYRKKTQSFLPYSSLSLFKYYRNTWHEKLIWLLPILYIVSISFWIIALARPQKIENKTIKNVEGIDILITLDISDSMLIEDMKPINRMEAAKQTIIDFVKARSSDRIGVVIFAGEAFTLIPLTLDYELIQERVSQLTTAKDARIKDGTALGVALASAAARLKDSKSKTRVIIFITDGENNSGTIDPETGLEIVKGFDFKVYTIGLGRSGPTRIPIYSTDVFGNKIKSYQPFVSQVNEELLNRIAQETGGKFFSAYDEKMLNKVFNEIDRLEKHKVEVSNYTQKDELFQNPLLWGVILIMVTLFLDHILFKRFPPC